MSESTTLPGEPSPSAADGSLGRQLVRYWPVAVVVLLVASVVAIRQRSDRFAIPTVWTTELPVDRILHWSADGERIYLAKKLSMAPQGRWPSEVFAIDAATGALLPGRRIVHDGDRFDRPSEAVELPDGRLLVAWPQGLSLVDFDRPADREWLPYPDLCYLSKEAVAAVETGERNRDRTLDELLGDRDVRQQFGTSPYQIELGDAVIGDGWVRAAYARQSLTMTHPDHAPGLLGEPAGVLTLDLDTMQVSTVPLPSQRRLGWRTVPPRLAPDGQTVNYVNDRLDTVARDLKTGIETKIRTGGIGPTQTAALPFYDAARTVDLDTQQIDSVVQPAGAARMTSRFARNPTVSPQQRLVVSAFIEKYQRWIIPHRSQFNQWLHLGFVRETAGPQQSGSGLAAGSATLSSDAIRLTRDLIPNGQSPEWPQVQLSPDGQYLLLIEGRSDGKSNDPTPVHLIETDGFESMRPAK